MEFEKKDLTTDSSIDNNDDMTATADQAQNENNVSFKLEQSGACRHSWSKREKKIVWIAAGVIVILFVLISFFFKAFDIFGMLGF